MPGAGRSVCTGSSSPPLGKPPAAQTRRAVDASVPAYRCVTASDDALTPQPPDEFILQP